MLIRKTMATVARALVITRDLYPINATRADEFLARVVVPVVCLTNLS